jgi:hypothetical protein
MEKIGLAELQKRMLDDTQPLNLTKLDTHSVEAPYLYSKYITIHANEKMWLQTFIKQKKVMMVKKHAYYSGNGTDEEYKKHPLPQKIKTGTERLRYVEADVEVQQIQDRIDIQQIKVDMLTEFMKVLYQKTFHIKNAIEFQKFINGGLV